MTAKSGRSPFGKVKSVPMYVATEGQGIANLVSFQNGFAPVAEKVLPTVVNIASSKIIRSPNRGPMSPFFNDPFFRQFFGDDNSRQFETPRRQREQSLGSGVLVNADGYILTNSHVVSGATDIQVSLPDKREFKGRIVGTDAKTDVAVVKVDGKDLPVLPLGDSSKVRVGDLTLAVGNPFGIGETMTMGIISATGRGGLGIEDYEDFLQTDAAINPGNSGGALVNVNGDLVGLNTAILSGGGGNQGVGFAVPVNMARAVMNEILKHGKVSRGSLGVVIQPVTPALAKSFGLTGQTRGALVASITSGSPADRAGIKRGDIVLSLNGTPVNDSRDLSLKISMMSPGTEVKLGVFRNGHEQVIPATLAELQASPKSPAEEQPQGSNSGPRLGIAVDQLTPDLAHQLHLPANTAGLVVTEVQSLSPAESAGLHRGDVIQEVNRKRVATVDQFQSAVQQAGNAPILLLINRSGEQIYTVVQPK
jgi:serine protease Do